MRQTTIDHDVPLPTGHDRHGKRPIKYNVEAMEVGDSIFVAAKGISTNNWKARTGFTFTTRTCQEGGIDGVRAWRIA
jgi:hypothetical protein